MTYAGRKHGMGNFRKKRNPHIVDFTKKHLKFVSAHHGIMVFRRVCCVMREMGIARLVSIRIVELLKRLHGFRRNMSVED